MQTTFLTALVRCGCFLVFLFITAGCEKVEEEVCTTDDYQATLSVDLGTAEKSGQVVSLVLESAQPELDGLVVDANQLLSQAFEVALRIEDVSVLSKIGLELALYGDREQSVEVFNTRD